MYPTLKCFIISLLIMDMNAPLVFCEEPTVTHDDMHVTLSNGVDLPLVGLGLGNLPSEHVDEVLSYAAEELNYQLLDTSHSSGNEAIIGNNAAKGGKSADMHAVTKVWYTHLGYERTVYSVKASLEDLAPLKKIHVLLHWPRCYPGVEWMNCDDEEDALDQYVKEAGPRAEGEFPWVESWKALEDLYDTEERIVSIGISNFEPHDIEELLSICRIVPHLYQGNIWTFAHMNDMVAIMRENNIAFQAYNVMYGVFGQLEDRPFARHHLERLSHQVVPVKDHAVTWPNLMLGFLTQKKMSVVVRSQQEDHLAENAPYRVATVPRLSDVQALEMEELIKLVVGGEDAPEPSDKDHPQVTATFHNGLKSGAVDLYWINHETKERVQVGRGLAAGKSEQLGTFKGHVFEAVDNSTGKSFTFQVEGQYKDVFTIEEL